MSRWVSGKNRKEEEEERLVEVKTSSSTSGKKCKIGPHSPKQIINGATLLSDTRQQLFPPQKEKSLSAHFGCVSNLSIPDSKCIQQ